ncbi:glycosyltransferase family 2 protein [Phenylobacterium sp. LjRoot219]|uniref:glycosyltransferase family 2 protein n=1 Tax=Phenylobacterium sp. LjRoot219 TaxID=3342283 RepID=UPI003ECE8F94
MSPPLFTVLLPVYRPPDLLPFAVRSVLAQSCASLELFIVCDGAPATTVETAQAFAAADPRVRVFAHPKGERNGEAWRHLALQQASGRYVCQIADDDLWFDDHLTEAEQLMATADFGNLLGVQMRPDGTAYLQLADLGHPAVRANMQHSAYNFFGPTCAAYRLATYRALPVGWSPAPQGVWSDLFMWRKFLAQPGVRFATRPVATSLGFPNVLRAAFSLEQRQAEIAAHVERLSQPAFRDEVWRAALLDYGAMALRWRQQRTFLAHRNDAAEARIAELSAALARLTANLADPGNPGG